MKSYFTWHKFVYLMASLVAWFLLGILVHWLLEMPILYFLSLDFERYSFGFSYNQLLALHTVFTLVIILASISSGIYFGLKWYDKVYQRSPQIKKKRISRSVVNRQI